MTTCTEPTDPSPPQHPSKPVLNPLNPTGSNASPYAGETVSAESSTGIDMPLDLHGRSFRHAQAAMTTIRPR
jgi:hypothetical protein